MAFLGSAFAFGEGARMTGITDPHREVGTLPRGVVTGHRVTVPDDQHSVTEERFTLAHLPLGLIGFHGTSADGSERFATFQAAEPTAFRELCGEPDDLRRMLGVGLRRALRFNPRATVTEETCLTVDDLRAACTERDVAAVQVATWTAGDLVRGLIAELCGETLASVARGHAAGCAFPARPHDCRGDVFSDVFGQWSVR